MNARISFEKVSEDVIENEIKPYKIVDAVKSVTCSDFETYQAEDEKFKVVLWDIGAKYNIRRELVKRGCTVTVVPASTTAEQIKALNPDGIMLSNGPGDPEENVEMIAELKKAL